MADYDDIRSYIMNDVASLYPNSSSDGGYFTSPPDRWVYGKKTIFDSYEELSRKLSMFGNKWSEGYAPKDLNKLDTPREEENIMADDITEYKLLPIDLLTPQQIERIKEQLIIRVIKDKTFTKLIRKRNFEADLDDRQYKRLINDYFNQAFDVTDWTREHGFESRADYDTFRRDVIDRRDWEHAYADVFNINHYSRTYTFMMQVFGVLVADIMKQYEPIHKSNNRIVTQAIKEYIIEHSWIDVTNHESLTLLSERVKSIRQSDDSKRQLSKLMQEKDSFYHSLTYAGLQNAVIRARGIIPQRFDSSYMSTTEEEWLAELAVKAIVEIRAEVQAEITKRVMNFKFGQKSHDYRHLAKVYEKLADRQEQRLAPIKALEVTKQEHDRIKNKYALAQKILHGKWAKDSLYDKVKHQLKLQLKWGYRRDLDKEYVSSLIHTESKQALHSNDIKHSGLSSYERKRDYFANKAEHIYEVVNENVDYYVTDFEDFVYDVKDVYWDDKDNDWEALYKEYRKTTIKKSWEKRMEYYVKHARTEEQVRVGQRDWESIRDRKLLANSIDNLVPTSVLTISPKGKRLYQTA